MSYLFRVEKLAGAKDQLLGYDWIEVLAVEPWAIGRRSAEYGDWCDRTISVMYVCLTEVGLIRINSEDFWTAVEEFREYESETAISGDAAMMIHAGDRSVVQVGSTTIGNVHTGDRVGLLDEFPTEQLIAELGVLRSALREREAEGGSTIAADATIGALAEAEQAARSGDEDGVANGLKRVGRDVLSVARDLGVEVAAAAITKSAGL
jgi:hypothetical protein